MLAHMLDSLVRVSRRVDWGPLLPWASWTCHLLLSRERPCIRAWRVSLLFVLHSQTHNNHLRTDSKHEGVTPLAWKFDPPNEWYPFLHTHHQPKHDNCCPRRSLKCLIRESLAATRLQYISSVFPTVRMPAQVSSLCRETMRLLRITCEFCPVFKIYEIWM